MIRSILRRLDAWWLRLSGRLDTPANDKIIPWVVALILFIVLAALALARARSLEAGTNLAGWTQSAWLISGFEAPESSLFGRNAFADQAAFILLPIGVLGRWLPISNGLLVLQAAALAVGVVPVWRLARDTNVLRLSATFVLALAYCLYPALHNLNLADFHPEALAVPLLLAAARYGVAQRWMWFAVFAILAVACRADLALAVAGLGAVIIARGNRRAGAIVIGSGVAWAALSIWVIQPIFSDGVIPHVEAFATFGDGPGSILWGMVSHPHIVLRELVTKENFSTLVLLVAPVLFLPVFAPRHFFPVLPLLAFYFIADVPAGAEAAPQQLAAATPFIFLATATALNRTGRPSMNQVMVNGRVLGALAIASVTFFLQDSASSPFETPWTWGGRDRADLARLAVVERVDADDVAMVAPSVQPLLAERQGLYDLTPDILAEELPDDLVVVIFDVLDLRWDEELAEELDDRLESEGFTRAYEAGPVVAWSRLFVVTD